MTVTKQSSTTVEVEHFDVNSEEQARAGRPLVARFKLLRDGRGRGSLDVRVRRDNGELSIWAMGPSGGERGTITIGLNRAYEVVAFVNASHDEPVAGRGRAILGSSQCYLTLRRPYKDRQEDLTTADRIVHVGKGGSLNAFTIRFGPAQLAELMTLLREWAATALAGAEGKPQIGAWYAKGALPAGTAEQIKAWVMAGPEGRLCRIVQGPADARGSREEAAAHTAYALASRAGHLGGVLEVPLATFYGDGWRRIG